MSPSLLGIQLPESSRVEQTDAIGTLGWKKEAHAFLQTITEDWYKGEKIEEDGVRSVVSEYPGDIDSS